MKVANDIVEKKVDGRRNNGKNFKGIKSKGRPKGVKNILSTSLKKDIEQVYNRLGSADGFYKWAKRSPNNLSLFYRMMVSLVPKSMFVDANITHSLAKLSNEDLLAIIKKGEVLDTEDIKGIDNTIDV